MTRPVLYLFGSAAPPVLDIASVVEGAQRAGWDVCLGLTPAAADWLFTQTKKLTKLTGHPVRSGYKKPGEPDVWPPADVIAVAPATFNTINQWALGITDHFVVGVAAEAIGRGIPLVTMPCVNTASARHPAFDRSVDELRVAGVRVFYGEGGFVPHPPGQDAPDDFPWPLLFEAAKAALPDHLR
ncbi:flavoprotein [Streptomyces sp. NPDC003300]|uniref:flavoprotein n=1 Tax=unclassified Streptomyces TaxID=2593676 RepID=UPI0033AD1361